MIDAHHRRTEWAAAFPEPDQRRAWIAEFPGYLEAAAALSKHINDPVLARRWFDTRLDIEVVAYLHGHGLTPDRERLHGPLRNAETRLPYGENWTRNIHRHAALAYAHPLLSSADITLLVTAGLTLAEADQHITETGLTDRDTLTVLAGLR